MAQFDQETIATLPIGEIDPRMLPEFLAHPHIAAAIFLYVAGQIERLRNQLVSRAGLVVVPCQVFDRDPAKQTPRVEDSNPVVEHLDLHVNRAGVVN